MNIWCTLMLLLVDGPLLGRGSRIRRARSSRLHTANSGRTSTSLDQQYLFQHLDDASSYTSSDSGHVNPGFVEDQASHMTATRSFRCTLPTKNGINVVCWLICFLYFTKDMEFFINEVIQKELVQCSQNSGLLCRLDNRNCVSIPSRDRRCFSSRNV